MQTLCDAGSGRGALQCQNYGGCPGAYNSNCYPNCVWSGTFISTDRYDYRCLGNDGFASYTQPSNQGLGVRCVLGFETIKFKRYLHFCHIFSFSSIIGLRNQPLECQGLRALAEWEFKSSAGSFNDSALQFNSSNYR